MDVDEEICGLNESGPFEMTNRTEIINEDNMEEEVTNERHTKHVYEDIVAPLCKVMAMFGLVFQTTNVKQCGKKMQCIFWVYYYILVVFVWLNVGRYFGAYTLGEPLQLQLILKFAAHMILFWYYV